MIWNKIEDKKPLTCQAGPWDGLKSDKVLVYTSSGRCCVAEMYEGVLDGTEFCDFYDDCGEMVQGVVFWSDDYLPQQQMPSVENETTTDGKSCVSGSLPLTIKDLDVEALANKLYDKWKVTYNDRTYMPRDLLTLAIQDIVRGGNDR